MTRWKGSLGGGRVLMESWSRLHWRWRPLARIRRIGEKNGTKRSLLVDGNGIPLSLVVAGAQRHDVKVLEPTLDEIVIDRPSEEGPKQHLCADKAYAGQPAQESMEKRGYIPHVRQRGEEMEEKKKKETHAIVLADGW